MNLNHRRSFTVFLGLAALLLLPEGSGWAQAVVTTVHAGSAPEAVAVNTLTHKIYVANFLGSNVTIIDAATDSTTTVPTIPNGRPVAIAVNQVTNKIYVASIGSIIVGGSTSGVTVIDGATNSTTMVIDPNGSWPRALAVNSVTNKIYVANFISGNVTVIDGKDNSTTTVTDPNASGLGVYDIAVNEATNKIYALNNSIDRAGSINPGSITVIDGVLNTTTSITDPDAVTPVAVALNPVTNKIYVANTGGSSGSNHGNVTVIDGATYSTTTVTDPNTLAPQAVAVNSSTNKIYVANINDSALSQNGGVTVIDGATDSISNVRDPSAVAPSAVAVDQATNRIYVANYGLNPPTFGPNSPGSVTVIDGSTGSVTNLVDTNAINPTAVSTDSTTGRAYVANVYSDNVTVIDDGSSLPVFSLSVTNAGNGSGTVVSSPAGINCPATCSASFPSGTLVRLTASPSSGSTLAGWNGACSGAGACSVPMSSASSATATFTLSSAPDFSLAAASQSLTVPRGGQNTDAITIAALNGPLATAIQLACTVAGPAPMPTCTLNPPSVTPGSKPTTSTLTISLPAASSMSSPTGQPQLARFLYATWLTLLFGLVAVAGLNNRRSHHFALGACLILLLLGLVACGGGGSHAMNQQPESYVVTIVGTSGSIQHADQVTVIAQ